MSIKVEVVGGTEAKAYLKSKNNQVISKQQLALQKAALFLQGEVKESIAGRRAEPTSVDTGRFLNSVNSNVGKDDAVVFSDVPYSQFLEYGTTRMSARRHFNNSKDRNKQKVSEIIEGELKNI